MTTRLFTVDEQGFTVDRYEIVWAVGHARGPANPHLSMTARTLDELPVDEMILPLAVLDLHKEAEEFHNLAVTVDHIKAWEERNGRIPDGAFVALRTDWSKRWETDDLYGIDAEGKRNCPGWSLEALKFLRNERGVVAIGHETTDTDPGAVE